MMLHVPDVLTPGELTECRRLLNAASWEDGLATAGNQAARVKRNHQLPERAPSMVALRGIVTRALLRHPLFFSAALPHRILPPYFNRYQGGEHFGNHVDNAVRHSADGATIRADVSTTLFLCDPEEYEGGELIVDDAYGSHSVRLPAGDAIVYPSSSLHRVEPVTVGVRTACFLWVQSMVREDARRAMLFELDTAIQRLRARHGDEAELVSLTGHYHNLLRMWVEV